MTDLIIQFLISAGTILVAGIFLTRAADSIANLTRLGRLFVGSIFLALATSLPELSVDIRAIQNGMPDLAVGDLVGSSLANLFILAVADLMHRGSKKVFSRASAEHALSASLSISMTAVAGMAILLGPQFAHVEIASIGVGPISILCVYLFGIRLVYLDQKASQKKEESNSHQVKEKRQALIKAIGIYFASAAAIFLAGPALADSAGKIAERTGLGETFIGTTLVALCTSLPEVVSTLSAVRMGAIDLAIGNIFGSNAFNMILTLPLDAFHEGALLASVSSSHAMTLFAVVFATSIALIGQLYQVEKRKVFIEPDAFLVMTIVVGSLALLYFTGAN